MFGLLVRWSQFAIDPPRAPCSLLLTLQSMFEYAEEFNADISKWDTSSVTNMKVRVHCDHIYIHIGFAREEEPIRN